MPTKDELKLLQALPLEVKIMKTRQRIREWVQYFGVEGVYISFSGGKDSTVLLDIARKMYPNIEAVFINTGLEYPEIKRFVKGYDNVTVLQPQMKFHEVIVKYGYPLISKEIAQCVSAARISLRNGKDSYKLRELRGEIKDSQGIRSIFNKEKWYPLLSVDFNISEKCCQVMKKQPARQYEKQKCKVPITAQMSNESKLRKQQWLRHGCNAFAKKTPVSNPMSFWTEQDVLHYIIANKLRIASVYGEIVAYVKRNDLFKCTGCQRTGCVFCGFGAHLDKGKSRFELLKETHPKLYRYCLEGGAYDQMDRLWKPSAQGLGMRHVFDKLSNLYGKDFIRY